MRYSPLLLTLALVTATGCSTGNESLLDFDGDGSLDENDCDSADAQIHPGAADDWGDPLQLDSNCDGADGIDQDGDGWAVNAGGDQQDCNDDDPTIHGHAADSVGDGIDQNCDGADGIDADGDLHGSLDSGGDDCNDNAPSIHAGASDAWGNGIDEDCDNCPPGAGDSLVPGDGIDTDCDGYALNGPGFDQDCNDADSGIYPGSTERWESPRLVLDIDCDGFIGTRLHSVFPSFVGEQQEDESGNRIAAAGDVNGDGLDDLLIGAPYSNEGQELGGKTYLIFGKREVSAWNTDLSSPDVSFLGHVTGARGGKSVASAGDVDGDGLSDILIGGPGDDDGEAGAGATYLFFGSTVASGGTFYLSEADAIFTGEVEGDESGYVVAGAGDVDGDRHDDILIGAWSNDEAASNAGKSYLILGASVMTRLLAEPTNKIFELTEADMAFVGEDWGDQSGDILAGAGDVDGDGLADILIGAWAGDGSSADTDRGRTYLLFGSTLVATMNFSSSINLAYADAIFEGEEYSESAESVATAGDVNGDGFADFLIGAPKDSSGTLEGGATYLFFGRMEGFSGTYSVATADVQLLGENGYDESGCSLSTAGDVDGDGYSDILIGAVGNDEGGSTAGKTYLVLGADILGGGVFDLNSSEAAFIGENQYDRSGDAVSTAGDANGDGLADLLIGAEEVDIPGENVGEVYRDAGKSYLILAPYDPPPYSGLWTLSASANYSCWSGATSVELGHLNITHRPSYAALDPSIIANAYELTMDSRTSQPGLLEGGLSSNGIFTVSRTGYINSSACTATWALTGSYTGPDTLSADFTATFTGSCGDCTNQSFPVTATR